MLVKEARLRRIHIFFGMDTFFEQAKQTNKWEQISEHFLTYFEWGSARS